MMMIHFQLSYLAMFPAGAKAAATAKKARTTIAKNCILRSIFVEVMYCVSESISTDASMCLIDL